jgi:chromosome segregation ATPase
MDDTTTTASGFRHYTSSYRNLAWSFRASRDNWKRKYQLQHQDNKRLKNQVQDVRQSREQWRAQAEQAQQELATAQTELARLRQALPDPPATGEKKG